MAKTIFFVDLSHCGTITNADTFPLGVACVAAYAKSMFKDNISVEIFKLPHDLNDRLKDGPPNVICFSNYVWNHFLTLAFARHIRKTWPDVPIIMGGPNISTATDGRIRFLQENPCVDFYVKFEGERAFARIMETMQAFHFDLSALRAAKPEIENTLYLADGDLIEGPQERIFDLTQIPSPYLNGMMDKFFEQGLRPLVEFVRGCPYACTFCTDSHEHRNKVMRRPADVVRAEMTYIAKHMQSASDMVLADLNFGQYKEDVEVSEIIRETIDTYGWPRSISCSPGKSQADRVMKCVKIINGEDRGIMKFASSVQSTDTDVLSAISRKNLPMDKLQPIMDSANHFDDHTEYFTEIILGLPLDSVERHYNSLRDTIDRLGMNIVNVHQLTLLQGSPMALPEQRERYQLDVRHRVFVGCIGTYEVGSEFIPIAEFEEVVVANSTMSYDEWLQCRIMSLLVKVYIDRDYFIEVFGFIKRLGLSAVDLLEIIKSDMTKKYAGMSDVIDRFLLKTEEPLHDRFEDIQKFVLNTETVEKFRTGELGGNELLVHRALLYLNHQDDLHGALHDAAKELLARNDLLTDEYARYLEQAVHYSQTRKFSPRNFATEIVSEFDFDFPSAKASGYRVLPSEIKMGRKKMRFYFNDLARSEIKYALQTWVKPKQELLDDFEKLAAVDLSSDGQTMYSFGKLFHNSNLRVMNRSVQSISAN